MIQKIKFKNKQGNHLIGIFYDKKNSNKPAVIFSHGLLDCKVGPSRIFPKIAKELYKKGYSALRFDSSFCGESDGKATALKSSVINSDLKCAINIFKNKEIILLGHSAGALASLVEAIENKSIKKIVLLAMPIDLDAKRLANASKVFSTAQRVDGISKIILAFDYFIAKLTYNIPKLINQLKIKTLLIYIDKDTFCDYSEINKIKNPFVTLLKVKNTNHFFKNKEKFIINKVVKWIENGR